MLFRKLYGNNSHWGSARVKQNPLGEASGWVLRPSDGRMMSVEPAPDYVLEHKVSDAPSSRRLREPFQCETLAGPDDRRAGHKIGAGGGLADYTTLATGDIFNIGKQNAIAGHKVAALYFVCFKSPCVCQTPGALDIWNETGHPVDTTMKLRRFQALRDAKVSPSLILTADFDQNGKLDILVFGSRNILFLQVISTQTELSRLSHCLFCRCPHVPLVHHTLERVTSL